jgi:8-amino-7-oxononanoate synthase
MDILDKYSAIGRRHVAVLEGGEDPFGVHVEDIHSATEAQINGRRVILLGTNNYLGLTFDPVCVDAAAQAIRRHGTGTTGSRIAGGTYAEHRALEAELADFLNRRSSIVFSTGYQANLGMIVGLAGAKDVIFLDADSHASIYDGCRLSGATLIRFRHNDVADLDRRLSRVGEIEGAKLIIAEGLYSMRGDRAPIGAFVDVKRKHGAYIMVDEAHSFGVVGDNGRGVAEADGVEDEIDFIVGTFSKSLGAIGGFGASNHPKFDVLRLCSRPYMYTASPSPSNVVSAMTALRQIRERPELRKSLWNNANALHEGLIQLGFKPLSEPSPIAAIGLPDEAMAVAMWNRLLNNGVYVNLALPPGAPNGVPLLRCSVSAAHRPDQIALVCDAFDRSMAEVQAEMGSMRASVAASTA